jgi:hypothetical protein
MPFLGTVGGSNEAKGQGGYHPGQSPIDTASSSAAGSLGTSTMNGAYNSPGSSGGGGQRNAIDPFNQGSIVYTISSGALPPGFSLNSSTGAVSGSYTAQGINTDGTVYTFTVRATVSSIGSPYTERTYTITLSVPYPYRQIITRNYMAGGYQGSQLWSNVNRTTHSNDTSTNLGDGCIDNFHYKSGATADNYGYIWNTSSTSRFNLRTEVKSNSTGAPPVTCNNTGTVFDGYRTKSFTMGDGTGNPFKFTFSNETFTNITSTSTANDHCSGISGESIGVLWYNGGGNNRINWSTEAFSSANGTHAAYGQQKGFNGKYGYGYGSTGGSYNGGTSLNKINLTTTDTNVSTSITKPCQNQGEDNNGLGQLACYTIGGYDAVGNGQNNRSGKIVLATDSASEIGGALQPGGHVGASSAHCFHRD